MSEEKYEPYADEGGPQGTDDKDGCLLFLPSFLPVLTIVFMMAFLMNL